MTAKSVTAAPASPSFYQETLPDGSIIELRIKGDEYFSWKVNKGGDVIIKNKKTGFYEFAVLKHQQGKEKLVPSGVKAIIGPRPSFSKELLENQGMRKVDKEDLKRLHKQAKGKRKFIIQRKPLFHWEKK